MLGKPLENFIIHGFRGLRSLELPGLGRINLLVGPNNSGKTSVLEAVSTFCQPLNPIEWIDTARRREMKMSNLLDSLKWLFPRIDNGEEELYQGKTFLSGEGNYPLSELRAHYQEAFTTADPDDDYSMESLSKDAQLKLTAVVKNNRSAPNERMGKIVRTFRFKDKSSNSFHFQKEENDPGISVSTITPFSHWAEPDLIKKLTDITLGEKEEFVIKAIQHMDPDIYGALILSKHGVRPSFYIKHRKLGIVPLCTFGDGVRRILSMALYLSLASNGALLIDEVETAIHKSALAATFKNLITACIDLNIQLFATTHSLEAVDAFLSAASGADNEVVAYRLPEPHSDNKVKRFSSDILNRLRYNRGLDVR